jgi:hypothetical protein
VVTSVSPLRRAVRETRGALDELTLGDQLLTESWRRQLAAARTRVVQLADNQEDGRTLRSVRALVATAAHEQALAAQFESRLVRLSDQQLREVSAELEVSFAELRGARAEAAAHLECATEDLLAEFRAELAAHRAAVLTGPAIRRQQRFVDDVLSAMRTHRDRIERLLLELGEAAQAAVGVPAGGLLPTRESHVPPRPDLGEILVEDVAQRDEEISAAIGRSIDVFRDRLAGQVEEAIETLRARIDSAVQCHRLGDDATRQRVEDLARAAHHLTELSERLDRMLFDGG